jgi:hypothetical protein
MGRINTWMAVDLRYHHQIFRHQNIQRRERLSRDLEILRAIDLLRYANETCTRSIPLSRPVPEAPTLNLALSIRGKSGQRRFPQARRQHEGTWRHRRVPR